MNGVGYLSSIALYRMSNIRSFYFFKTLLYLKTSLVCCSKHSMFYIADESFESIHPHIL